MYVNFIFFLGIKNKKFEIRNSVFDQTKPEKKIILTLFSSLYKAALLNPRLEYSEQWYAI